MTDRFTPGPWSYVADDDYGDFFRISGHEQYSIATLHDPLAESCGRLEELEANARRIVHCVNHFDELVDALETLLAYSALETSSDEMDQIAAKSARAVLEKVKK